MYIALIILGILGLISLIIYCTMTSINNTDSHYGMWKEQKLDLSLNDENDDV